jgi:hypothetical protein
MKGNKPQPASMVYLAARHELPRAKMRKGFNLIV